MTALLHKRRYWYYINYKYQVLVLCIETEHSYLLRKVFTHRVSDASVLYVCSCYILAAEVKRADTDRQ